MPQVSEDMLISDVLSSCPGAIEVFERFGLACGSCLAASMETLDAIAAGHDVSLADLISALNGMDDQECSSGQES